MRAARWVPSASSTPSGVIEPASILIKHGRIAAVEKGSDRGEGLWAVPGFVDTHCHGAVGVSFGDPDPRANQRAIDYHRSHGTTTLFASTVARPVDSLMLATQRFGLANSAAAESDYRQALNHLAAALASPALSHSATAPGADSALGDALWQVFKQARHNSAANQEPSAREQIQQQLKQLTEAALAQLTVHRSRGLLSSSPSAPLSQQLHLADLPIRFGDHTYGNVLLQIQELAINEGRQQKSRRDKRRKAKWTAYMELTLEDESGLAVEMSLMDRTLDATFWCGTEALQQQSTQGLEQLKMALQADGIEVADLRCVAKAPPPKAHALTVSLIDTQG